MFLEVGILPIKSPKKNVIFFPRPDFIYNFLFLSRKT